VVFGGEDRLREQIRNTADIIDADIYFVITGCTTGLIGDNVKAVVAEFADKGHHLVFAETAGFIGDSYKGYDVACNALIEQVTRPAKKTVKNLVNLFGIVAGQNPFWQGDIEEIVRLLGLIGVKVNLSGSGDTLRRFEDAAKAELNIVLSGSTGIAVAETLEREFGTPYIVNPLPIGSDTAGFLRRVASELGLDEAKVEKVIEAEESRYWDLLIKYSDAYAFVLSNKSFSIIGDSANAVGATRFLTNDLGLTPGTVVLVDEPTEAQREEIKERLGDLASSISPKVVFETDSGRIWERVAECGSELILGSSSDRLAAAKARARLIPYSFPLYDQVVLSKGYAGYRGAINLAEEIGCRMLSG